MTKNDGGPAFPLPVTEWNSGNDGMTLRDWFAGQAIRAKWGNGTAMTEVEAARFAYQLADTMIAEREAGHE